VRVHRLRVALAGPAQRLRIGGGERQRAAIAIAIAGPAKRFA
jgi:ABC-type glutathione transport system ATPase component